MTLTPQRVHEKNASAMLRAATRREMKRKHSAPPVPLATIVPASDWTRAPREVKVAKPRQTRKKLISASEREIEILKILAEGYTNKEISAKLFISEETVKTHVRHLLKKLGGRSRAHLVHLGYQKGLLTTGSTAR